jgi:hypothetical protein
MAQSNETSTVTKSASAEANSTEAKKTIAATKDAGRVKLGGGCMKFTEDSGRVKLGGGCMRF